MVFGLQVAFELIVQGAGYCLEGLQRLDLSRGADALRRTVVAVATAAVALGGGGLRGVAWAAAVGTAVGAVAAVAILRARGGRMPVVLHRGDAREMVGYAGTVAALNGVGVLNRTMNRLVVGWVLGPAAVALVEIATQIQNAALAVLTSTSYVALSSSSWVFERRDHARLTELALLGTKYSMLATVPLAVLAAVLAEPLVHLWVGDRYDDAAGLVVLGLAYVVMASPVALASYVLQGVGQAKTVLWASLPGAAVNLVASFVLVEVVGIAGAFQATLLAMLVVGPLLARALVRQLGVPLGGFVRRSVVPALGPAVAAGLGAGVAVALPLGDAPTVAVGVVLGVALAVPVALWVAVDRDEIGDLVRTVRR